MQRNQLTEIGVKMKSCGGNREGHSRTVSLITLLLLEAFLHCVSLQMCKLDKSSLVKGNALDLSFPTCAAHMYRYMRACVHGSQKLKTSSIAFHCGY